MHVYFIFFLFLPCIPILDFHDHERGVDLKRDILLRQPTDKRCGIIFYWIVKKRCMSAPLLAIPPCIVQNWPSPLQFYSDHHLHGHRVCLSVLRLLNFTCIRYVNSGISLFTWNCDFRKHLPYKHFPMNHRSPISTPH